MSQVYTGDYPESPDSDSSYYKNKTKKSNPLLDILFKPECPPKKGDKAIYDVRILPYRHKEHFDQFIDVFYHYQVGKRTIVCPKYMENKPCKICDYRDTIYERTRELASTHGIDPKNYDDMTKNPQINALFELARKYKATKKVYIPILVRGKETEGAKFWGINQKLCDFILADLGKAEKVVDRYRGFDSEIVLLNNGAMFMGKPIADVSHSFKVFDERKPILPKQSPEDIQALIDSVPNLFDFIKVSTYEDTAKALDEHNPEGDSDVSFGSSSSLGSNTSTPTPELSDEEAQDATENLLQGMLED